MNGAARAARDMDGETDRSNGREHMSQSGSRTSFNRGNGISEIEGKSAMVAPSKAGAERVSIEEMRHRASCVRTGKKGLDHLMSAR